MSMAKWFLFMWLCSYGAGVQCELIKTNVNEFKDEYDCTLYGYTYSAELIEKFGREEVNKLNLYTKFLCRPFEEPKTET